MMGRIYKTITLASKYILDFKFFLKVKRTADLRAEISDINVGG